MKEFFNQYIAVIVDQREWSWALIAVLYFIATLIIRNWFLRPIIAKAKLLDKKYYHEIKTNYLNQCAFGWLLILASTGIISFLWFSNLPFPFTPRECFLIGSVLLLSLLAIVFHLSAFCYACINAVKKSEDNQKVT